MAIFDLNYRKYEQLCTESYLKSVWKYINEMGIRVQAPIDAPKPARVNDRAIMDIVMDHKTRLSDQEITMIKYCRLYLQVYYISDITTGNGKQVTDEAYRCVQDSTRKSKIKWQYQPQPSFAMIRTWQKMLHMLVINIGTALKVPLKEWTNILHMSFGAWMESDERTVYVKCADGWEMYTRIGRSSQHKVLHKKIGIKEAIPVGLVPTTITRKESEEIYSYGYAEIVLPVKINVTETIHNMSKVLNRNFRSTTDI